MIAAVRHRARQESGAVLIIVAISLVALLGFAALAIDVGSFYQAQRQAQAAADAGALAGAADIVNNQTAAAAGDATTYAQTNDPNFSSPIAVSQPDGAKVRVTVNATPPAFFGRFFGLLSTNVSATAVAAATPNATQCGQGGTTCYTIFAMSTACSPAPVTIATGNDSFTGSVHSNGGFNASGGNDSFGNTTYGTGCTAATKSGQSYTSGPTAEAPITTWPWNYALQYPSCNTDCTGPFGTPWWCTAAAPSYANLNAAGNTVYCAWGTGNPKDPSTWNGSITGIIGAANTTYVGGSITASGGTFSPYPGTNLTFYATTGDITESGTITGDTFAPNGQITLNGGGTSFVGFLEGNTVYIQNGGITGDGPQDAPGTTTTSASATLVQ